MDGFTKKGRFHPMKKSGGGGISKQSIGKDTVTISKGPYPTKRLAWIEAGKRTGWKPDDVTTKENSKSFTFIKK